MAIWILLTMVATAWYYGMTTYTTAKGFTRSQRYVRTFGWMLFFAILWGAGMQHV